MRRQLTGAVVFLLLLVVNFFLWNIWDQAVRLGQH